jgi:hypothetical protein
MAPWLVHSTCDRGSEATFAIVGHRMGDQKFIIWSSSVLWVGMLSRRSRLVCSREQHYANTHQCSRAIARLPYV